MTCTHAFVPLLSDETVSRCAYCQQDQPSPLFGMMLATLENYYYKDDELAQWLQSPQPLFGGKTPLGMLAEGRKAELYQSIRQLDEGAYS